jgi:murein DD-endopeptidase MepM/ murein hydrolase activator NlpD
VLFIHGLITVLVYENYIRHYFFVPNDYAENVSDPTEKTTVPTPLPIPSIETPVELPTENVANQTPEINANQAQTNLTGGASDVLMIPVLGVKREQLQDTFNDARSAGRVHNAIDIMAALGTPVVAVADGEIAKFFDSERGGITIYQYSADRRRVYYYAHLQKRADNLKEKDFVKRGTEIGYVGDTGNSGAGNYHLHFTVTVIADGQRYWEGSDVNPYPLLKDALESR